MLCRKDLNLDIKDFTVNVTTKKAAVTGLYLYAIASKNEALASCKLQGIQDGLLHSIVYKDIMLVMSSIEQKKLRPERKNIAAHHAVLNHLMTNHVSMLPMRFGVIADSKKDALHLLSSNYTTINEKLKSIAGRVEMGVSISWDVPNIFEYLLSRHALLRDARDKLLADKGHQPSRDEKIEIGGLFSQILEQERESNTEIILSVLSPVCVDIIKGSPHTDTEVMNLSCLIAADKREEFDSKIDEASKLLDDNFVIKYTGPWPPHNFSKLNLSI